MREDLISSHWRQLREAFRKQWPRLTESDLAIDHGDLGYLIHVLQHRYAIGRFEAWKQVHEFNPEFWFFESGGQVDTFVFRSSQCSKEKPMNEDRIKGQWKQLHGKLKARWGKLTDDDLAVADGSTEYLAGKLQERYGIARDAAKKQIQEFDKDL